MRYLLLADVRRLLDYLKARRQGYGSALVFHLANTLFQTACRFDELIQFAWAYRQAVGKQIVAFRIKARGTSTMMCRYRTHEHRASRVEKSPGWL